MVSFKLFTVVALLRDIPDQGLRRGQVGTVVDIYPPTAAEVEFVDGQGHTYALTTLHTTDLMELHHQAA